MDMHCVPQDEVGALIRECGGTLVDTEKELVPGGFQSYRYWVVREPKRYFLTQVSMVF